MTAEKVIWVPKSETKMIVQDGVVLVSDEMTMHAQPIKKPATGFSEKT